jgi:hypothetical protein
MAVSYVGSATGSTTATVPAHAIGDLIVIAAWNTSATLPTMGAGYTSAGTVVNGASASGRVAYRVATATNDASGTWSNCVSIWCVVYSGTGTPGTATSNTGSGTAIGYPALTLTQPGASWVVRPGAALAASTMNSSALTGYTNRVNGPQVATFDSNGTVATAGAATQTVTGSGAWVTLSLEIPPAASAVPTNQFFAML